ncbi:VOC family protein [Sphingosinicella sp.]|uniref:VOC family protein n=1 Tax=Sphingosinicella sp. TaxID=1917971 RepID=UPI004037E168
MPYLAHIALVVRDYDEAIAFYVGKLGFTLAEDSYQPEQDAKAISSRADSPGDSEIAATGKRWVTIRPPGAPEHATTILLARASTPEQAKFVGDQAGGRVFLFLATDDFERDFAAYTAAGIEWVRPPADYDYGRVAVFRDLYGNLWDLVQFSR